MIRDIKEILLTEEQIAGKVKELATKISEDYRNKDLLVVGILKGSVMFASDLIKNIQYLAKLILWRYLVMEVLQKHLEWLDFKRFRS